MSGDPRSPDRVLVVPAAAVHSSWTALRATAEAGCEGVVYWSVPRGQYDSQVQSVASVIVPEQKVSAGNFQVPPAAVRAMGRKLREMGLVNVAQLHTHPGNWVGHSAWDDDHAFSLRNGALSIVWPQYGLELPPVGRWGVHECHDRAWGRLSTEAAARRVRILPGVLDLRDGPRA